MKKREHRLFIRVTDEERNCILDKMYGMGIHSLSAYIRKMALDGYCLNLDLPQLRRMAYLLQNCSNNLNQVAKRVNESGKIYSADLADLRTRLDELIDIGKQDKKLIPSLTAGGVDAAAEDVEHQRSDHITGQSEQPLCHESQKRHKERNREKNNFLQHRHHIKHFLSVRPYYKGIDYYVARMSSIICTPAVLQLREFL